MNETLMTLGTIVLFLCGLRLSAFFSGVETGFYRISFLRLNIDSQAGDRVAKRLLWFLQNPSYFVATCLVGNNFANYITTLAIGLLVGSRFEGDSGWEEVIATLLVSPVVFICGELLPKNLYFRAPMRFLRKDAKYFRGFYLLFLPISFPLIGIAKLFERFAQNSERQGGLALERNRLAQLLSQGHREGILMDVQNRMVTGLMRLGQERITAGMTPAARIIGVEEGATRDEILASARTYGAAYVVIRRKDQPDSWFAYARTIDVLLSTGPPPTREMPQFAPGHNRLEAMLALREQDARIGAVVEEGKVLGVVYEQGLIEALVRT
ncbi:MAG TPA: CNNM domain-containing protein [Planctomycetaceae bacterium]|nr:CNNM domain-containing protein [Planctomycetaceae bacterium]